MLTLFASTELPPMPHLKEIICRITAEQSLDRLMSSFNMDNIDIIKTMMPRFQNIGLLFVEKHSNLHAHQY